MNGQYLKRRPRRKWNPKFVALLSSLVLIVGLAVGSTLAFLIDTTSPVTNTFTPSKVDVTVTEDFDGSTKSDVAVLNSSDINVYVRARVIVNWVDESGNIITKSTADVVNSIDWGESWIPSGAYYIYPYVVGPNSSTANLIDSVKLPENSTDRLQIEILSEAIQATPADAVETAWGVTVNTDGTIG